MVTSHVTKMAAYRIPRVAVCSALRGAMCSSLRWAVPHANINKDASNNFVIYTQEL